MKIIAELCQNHNGSPDILADMVHAAASAGATHIKIQSIYTENIAFRPEFENGFDSDEVEIIKRPYKPEYDRLKSLELEDGTVRQFIEIVNDAGLIPLTTCFARSTVKRIIDQGFKEIKVASYDCGSYQLIRELGNKFDHIYISTGASFDNEIAKTAQILHADSQPYSFLHCVTIYPTPMDVLNLNRINWLLQFTDNVGFSDHTDSQNTGIDGTLLAIYLGANVIERHFTILERDETRDGPVSINAAQLKEISEFALLDQSQQRSVLEDRIKDWDAVMGSETRQLTKAELANRHYYRGRFASPRPGYEGNPAEMIFNWEETEV
jgi:N,N'-diacetyllegionaminate synthase